MRRTAKATKRNRSKSEKKVQKAMGDDILKRHKKGVAAGASSAVAGNAASSTTVAGSGGDDNASGSASVSTLRRESPRKKQSPVVDVNAQKEDIEEEFPKFKYVCLKCIEVKGELNVKDQIIAQLQEKVNALEEEKKELKEEKLQLLKFGETLSRTSGHKNADKTSLKTLEKAVDLEEEFGHFVIPDGMVYVGDGKTIRRSKLEDADAYVSIGMKLKKVCVELWPDGLHLHCLKLTPSIRIDGVQVVTKTELHVLKSILNAMTWTEDTYNVTEKLLKESLKHILSQARTDFIRENPAALTGKAPKIPRKRSATPIVKSQKGSDPSGKKVKESDPIAHVVDVCVEQSLSESSNTSTDEDNVKK